MEFLEAVKKSGLSQRYIARELGISPSRLGDVLHGRRPFPVKWIIPLCKIIGCDPNTLFGWAKIGGEA